jgi:hypothetical protein
MYIYKFKISQNKSADYRKIQLSVHVSIGEKPLEDDWIENSRMPVQYKKFFSFIFSTNEKIASLHLPDWWIWSWTAGCPQRGFHNIQHGAGTTAESLQQAGQHCTTIKQRFHFNWTVPREGKFVYIKTREAMCAHLCTKKCAK